MSSSIVSVNFKDLKYNLYEVLGLSKEASETRIKKNFRKLVLELHPDKNTDSSEDLYNHVIIANQVLSDSINRKKYDEFLEGEKAAPSFFDLKNSFEESLKKTDNLFPKKEEATGIFKTKLNELNQKHGFDAKSDFNVMSKYNEIKKKRETTITIPQEKISGNKDFNSKFEKRMDDNTFSDQIVLNNASSSLSSYQPHDGLVNIGDYSTLYSEDSISTGNFTSLDMAFKLQKINSTVTEKSLEERMKEYTNQSNKFQNRKPEEFSKKKFHDWDETDN